MYSLALAPGMGLNGYFAYSVVLGMHVPGQTALGAVFLSGIAFLLLTLFGQGQGLLATIPAQLYTAVSCAVGIFIAFIGLPSADFLVPHPTSVLTLGNVRDARVSKACFGFLLIAILMANPCLHPSRHRYY